MLARFETFINDINEIDLYWHRIANMALKPYGLKGNYGLYFTRLYSNPDGLTAARLGALCGKDKADVSRDISVLVKAGLVQKDLSGGNAYRVRISLTDQGRAMTEELIGIVNFAVGSIGQDLTDQDRSCFYRVLGLITENMRVLSEQGLPENLEQENKL